jgi:RNA polymerase sigma-70 factor (ECF subfamily)
MNNQGIGESPVTGAALDRDRFLVERIREGDQTALEELMRRYGRSIYFLALRYTKNRQDAEEVRQEVFLKVFRRIETFRAATWLSPWLFKIAVNTSLMKLREQRKHRVSVTISLEDWMPAGASEPDDSAAQPHVADRSFNAEQTLIRHEALETVRRAIEKLPKLYKNVLQLRDIDGLPLEAISHAVRISIPAVKSRLFRARRLVHKATRLLSHQGTRLEAGGRE